MADLPPTRPEGDFRITSLAAELENEASHRAAGFATIPRAVMVRRFWSFIDFLQENGLTHRHVVNGLNEVSDQSELRNLDLTDRGFAFVQRFHGRWLGRVYKDRGDGVERAFLRRWLDNNDS